MRRALLRIRHLLSALAVVPFAVLPVVSPAQSKPAEKAPAEKAEKKFPIQVALEEAEQKFVDRKYAEASKAFEAIIKDADPKNKLNTSAQPEKLRAFIQLRLASSYFYQGKWADAEKGLRVFLDKYPNGTEDLMDSSGADNFRANAQLTLAEVYAKQEKWEDAVALLERLNRDVLGLRPADRTRAAIALTRVLEGKNAKAGPDAVKKTAEENIARLLPMIASKNFMLPEVRDVGNRIIEIYTKSGDIKKARSLQEEMANRGRGTPLEIVNANFQRIEMGDQLFQDADQEGIPERRDQLYRQALTAYQETLRRSSIEYLIEKAIAEKQKAFDEIKDKYRRPNEEQQEIIDKAEAEKDSFVKTADAFKNNKDYDAFISFRIGLCLQSLGRDWEAYIAFKDVIDNYPTFKGISATYYWYIQSLKSIHRLKEAQELCREYLKKFPHENETPAIAILVGEIAFEQDDYADAVTQFRWVRKNVNSLKVEEKEQIDWYIVVSLFSNMEWEEARKDIENFIKHYPKSTQLEQMYYMRGLTYFYQGNYKGTMAGFEDYEKRCKSGGFKGENLPDSRYRLAIVRFGIRAENTAQEKSYTDEVISRCQEWLKDYANPPANLIIRISNQRPEIYTLLGDTYIRRFENKKAIKEWNTPEAKAKNLKEAISYYILAAQNAADNRQALDYALKELNKRLPALGDWAKLLNLYVQLYQKNPDDPKSLGYLYWIIRASEKLGKTELEKRAAIAKAKVTVPDAFVVRSAEEILADVIVKNIDDPGKENIEQLITELAIRMVRGARSVMRDPAIINKPDLEAQIEKLLKAGKTKESLIAKARGYYARSEVARLMNNTRRRDDNLALIARLFKADELSPTILGTVGDYLLAKGETEKALTYFQYILDNFRSSDFADFGFAGKAEILLKQGKFREAYEVTSDAVESDLLFSKEKEIMLARTKALMELGRQTSAGSADSSVIALAGRINSAAIPFVESKIKDAESALTNAKTAADKKTATEKIETGKKQLASLRANAGGLARGGAAAAKTATVVFLEFASQGFTDIAGNRAWRGEATAESLYCLGQIEEIRGKLEEAIVYYRRCYLTWKKYGNVTAKAYLRIINIFQKKGDLAGARDTLKLMLEDSGASVAPEAAEARKLLGTR